MRFSVEPFQAHARAGRPASRSNARCLKRHRQTKERESQENSDLAGHPGGKHRVYPPFDVPSLNVPLSSLSLNGKETGMWATRPASPHPSARRYFIIDERRGLMILAPTVIQWRKRFLHIC